MYLLLSLVIAFGVLAALVHTTFGAYDDREGVSIGCRQFWTLQPSTELMGQAPIFFQLHVLSALLLFAVRPFTRLVHVFAAPVGCLTGPCIPEQGPAPRVRAPRLGEGGLLMSARPPVTLQSDWETALLPWMREIAAHLEVGGVDLDVDRVHVMTGVVADGVQCSRAPISAFLVGAAGAHGAGLLEACAAVESLSRERAGQRRPG